MEWVLIEGEHVETRRELIQRKLRLISIVFY